MQPELVQAWEFGSANLSTATDVVLQQESQDLERQGIGETETDLNRCLAEVSLIIELRFSPPASPSRLVAAGAGDDGWLGKATSKNSQVRHPRPQLISMRYNLKFASGTLDCWAAYGVHVLSLDTCDCYCSSAVVVSSEQDTYSHVVLKCERTDTAL